MSNDRYPTVRIHGWKGYEKPFRMISREVKSRAGKCNYQLSSWVNRERMAKRPTLFDQLTKQLIINVRYKCYAIWNRLIEHLCNRDRILVIHRSVTSHWKTMYNVLLRWKRNLNNSDNNFYVIKHYSGLTECRCNNSPPLAKHGKLVHRNSEIYKENSI